MSIYFFFCLIYLIHTVPISAIVKNFYWRDYIHGDIPCDAYQGSPGLYIGQIIMGRSRDSSPATIYTSRNLAFWENNRMTTSANNGIKILCSPDNNKFYWEEVKSDELNEARLNNVVIGGSIGQGNVFIGKAFDEGEWKISRVVYNGSDYGLLMWRRGRTSITLRKYFILQYNMTMACHQETYNCANQ